MKIVSVVGARPQFVKAAAVSRVLRKTFEWHEWLIHTGQHYDANMSDVFFAELRIPTPDFHLGIGSGRHGEQTGQMLAAIEDVLLAVKPDWVVVYGDTNSTLAGALAAAKLHIPIAHVEAGLRSHNRKMPEEINRVLTDHAATLLLAPTEAAIQNLRREGFAEQGIYMVGDVMYDAMLFYRDRAEEESRILRHIPWDCKKYILATIHRAENTDDPARLRAIFDAFVEVAREIPVVTPLHPRTERALKSQNLWNRVANSLTIIPPVGYLDMVMLEANARLIATDSGGVQKEAFFCCTPCVTLRDETEWRELVELGWNSLCPPVGKTEIAAEILSALVRQGRPGRPFGDGHAAERIASVLAAYPAQSLESPTRKDTCAA